MSDTLSPSRAEELVAGVAFTAWAMASGDDPDPEWISADDRELYAQVIGTCALIGVLDGSTTAPDEFWMLEVSDAGQGTDAHLALQILAAHRNGDGPTAVALWYGDMSMAHCERSAGAFALLLRMAAYLIERGDDL